MAMKAEGCDRDDHRSRVQRWWKARGAGLEVVRLEAGTKHDAVSLYSLPQLAQRVCHRYFAQSHITILCASLKRRYCTAVAANPAGACDTQSVRTSWVSPGASTKHRTKLRASTFLKQMKTPQAAQGTLSAYLYSHASTQGCNQRL